MSNQQSDVLAPQVPGYEVLDLLGSGATGQVWAVRNREGVRLAAKLVPADSEQLDVEASLLTALEHDHVIRIHQVVELTDDRTALVMDLAEGGSVADALVERGHFSDGEVVTVLSPIARALHDLHGMGLVHADLSPGNILLTAAGKPLIADFGVSRLAGHAGEDSWATEAWAAPEILLGQAATPASDSYSLGAIAWACLTGRAPEPAALRPDLAELAPWSSTQLRDLVLSCLSHTPQARPSVGEFATLLWGCARAEPAPVKGSRGRRAGADLGPALTRRVERRSPPTVEQFVDVADEPDVVSPWSRRTRPLAVITAVALAAGVLAWVVPFGGQRSARTASSDTASIQATQSAAATAHSLAPATAVRTTSNAPSATLRSDTATGQASQSPGLTDPARVVTTLLDARSKAWRDGSTTGLTSYVINGSAAERKERSALDTMSRESLRYDGLAFTVRSATLRPGSGDPRVRAVIDQSTYGVTGSGGRQAYPAQAGQRVDLTLRWTGDGWRLVDWTAA